MRSNNELEQAMKSIICTVDVVLLTLQEHVLKVALLKREQLPFQGLMALPGGFIHADEDQDAKQAARRVLKEKARLDPPYLEQLATFSGPKRDPRGWSVSITYYALVSFPVLFQVGQSDLTLFATDALPELPFDHAFIIQTAVRRLRDKSQYSSLPCYLAGEQFTLPQLQRIYETLMGEPLNKVSFRRKMSEMDMLEEVPGGFEATGPHRPAQLVRLRQSVRNQLTLLERGL
jgi:8-oxo-dGTP diphosphatase